MPLSETNKAQSQSIEDLIAQLDSPNSATPGNNNSNNANNNQNGPNSAPTSKELNGSNLFNTNNNTMTNGAAANRRQQMKGRRLNSTSFSFSSTGSGSGGANATSVNTFAKTASFGQNSEPLLSKNIITSKKYSKKLGRLRDKGAPKKNGGGGKHTWGKPGCELQADYLDSGDPNYDSEEAGNVVMVGGTNEQSAADSSDGEETLKQLDADEMDSEIKPVILEYFMNGDTIEVINQLKMYNLSRMRAHVVCYLVQLALENNNTSKELVSRLLRDATFELFRKRDYELAFDLLLRNLNDLTLDNPDAPETAGTFLARAIVDKVLGKEYLDRLCDGTEVQEEKEGGELRPDVSNEKVAKAVEKARLLINMNDHLYYLSHIWGNKGGFLAVQELTDKINEIIQEYFDSADVTEAIRCLKELNVPHFHHEFVFEAIDFALQKGNDHAIELITDLLHRLCQSVIITYDQLKMGILRIFDILPDIRLDVPNANALMDKILNKCQSKGFVGENILDSALNKSRKRFVSEGDGGKIKENGL